MRRLTPGRGPSSRPGQLYAVEEPPSQKLHPLSRNRRRPCASSHSSKRIRTGCPIEKPILQTGTKKNQPPRRRNDSRATPRENGGLNHRSSSALILGAFGSALSGRRATFYILNLRESGRPRV